jgi:XTP/dITP diphosphohydrolase
MPLTEPIVIATGNPKKIEEIRAVLAPIGVEVVGLSDLPGPFEEPVEGKDSFLENATLKAVSYARQTGRICLADDSGLEVDALGGAPGVISSHYATDGEETGLTREQRDEANNARLLADLEGVAPEDRSARFVCTMVLARPDGTVLATVRGAFEGRIGLPGDVPRGDHGFGYDPLVLMEPDFQRTGAELTPEEKNARSHRGEAARRMAAEIRKIRAGH